ncbi:MAG: cation-transporting P-type ATPase, partial [Clostridia bacterium]|nr:cation-transporting P-type ATPase [Clostridia bacterium]
MNERWYDKTVRQVEEKLNTDSNTGLSPGVLKSRQRSDKMNVIFPVNYHSFEQCFKKVLSEPSLVILLIVALFAAILEQSIVSYVIIGLVAFNIFLSVFMYRKSYQIFEDMGRLSMPTTKVLRNGKLFLVKSEQLVEGDVIFLSSGDMVPADARLVEADGLQVLEVNITGEIKPAEKDPFFLRYTHDVPAAQQANMVFASTIVVKGSAKAICCYTGEDTLVCKLKKNTKLVQQEKIKAISFTKKYSKNASLLSIVLIFALIILQLAFGNGSSSLFDIFLTALSFAVAASAEFYVLSAYVVVANGLFSAVKQNKHINSGALIKNISKTEALKDISCLLVHKEGAFSIKGIRAEKVYVNSMLYSDGEVHFSENAASVLRFALISTGLYGARKIVKNNLNNDNIYSPEEEAIINLAQKCKV